MWSEFQDSQGGLHWTLIMQRSHLLELELESAPHPHMCGPCMGFGDWLGYAEQTADISRCIHLCTF